MIWRVLAHWFYTAWFGYTYPSLKGNGPEDFLFGTIIGGLFSRVHRKIDHIIKHSPDIPPVDRKRRRTVKSSA